MKKLLVMALALCMMLNLSACGLLLLAGAGTESNNENTATKPATESTTESATKPTTKTEAPSDPYKITFSSVNTYHSFGVWAQAIVEIENTSSYDLFLKGGTCDLEDSEGNLVASKDISAYPQIIAPGEKGYYFDEYLIESLTEPIELKIIPRPQIVKSTTAHITYSVADINITDCPHNRIVVLGRVENTSGSKGSMVYVAITLFNEASEPIGLAYTVLTDNLTPGQKVGFETARLSLPDGITSDSIASYTAVAYPYQLQIDLY